MFHYFYRAQVSYLLLIPAITDNVHVYARARETCPLHLKLISRSRSIQYRVFIAVFNGRRHYNVHTYFSC